MDTFLYDIKRVEKKDHLKYIGVDNTIIKENLKCLSDDGAKIFLRLPLVANINATPRFVNLVTDFLKENNIHVAQINLLPYHNTGRHKYDKLDRPYDEDGILKKPSDELMNELLEMFKQKGYSNIKIGG